jgi:hypothetical protein
MALLLREILLDLANNAIVHHDKPRLIESGSSISWEYLAGWEQQCEVRCDVVSGLQHLLDTDQVDTYDILLLHRFMCGETLAEINQPGAKERLVALLALLEDTIGYRDDRYIDGVVRKYPKYAKTKDAYRDLMLKAEHNFEEIVI